MTNNPTIDGVLREEFERSVATLYCHADLRKRSDGCYINDQIQSAWWGWKERSALLDAPAVERQKIVSHRDDWFEAIEDENIRKEILRVRPDLSSAVERQEPVAEVVATGGPHDREDRVLVELQAELPPIGTKIYAAPPKVAALQSTITRLEARITQLESEAEFAAATYQASRDRIAELESGRGEPVAWMYKREGGEILGQLVQMESDNLKCIRLGKCHDDGTRYMWPREDYIEWTPLFTAPPAPVAAVPDGWKLVPVEPTAEMLENLAAEIYPDDKEAGLRLQRLRGTNVVFPKHEIEMAVGKYARMLDASPACLDATAALNGVKS